uniref:Bowman-Birk type proteinase inhibitor A2 n=2 Tax=Hyacinthus orientalis TaxID=82025 RepID=IBBA2_HYAOR|nr:RecName: Full=Bowman-Birk type proteinase inhibitor A2; Short=HOSPI-A2 [Hyacinthus orientalis]
QTWPPVEGRPSCKRCGACTRMWPPEANRCVCDDIVPQCHEGCSKCEKVDTRSGKPLYQCQSFEYYNCAA